MPAIPDTMLQGTVFLYRTKDEAEKHVSKGGTGFLIGKRAAGTDQYIMYLVTNRHVVYETACSVLRVNRKDGGKPDVFETEPDEWIPHPDGDDLAVLYVNDLLSHAIHAPRFVLIEDMITQKQFADLDIGVGEEVFMIGRFVNYQGVVQNMPAVRFGNLSVGLSQIMHPIYKRLQDGFAVEMRSRTGFSGSPVFLYFNEATTFKTRKSSISEFKGLLGVNWGYINDEDGENTWLNGVVPAWKIIDIMNTPHMLKQHEVIEDIVKKRTSGTSGGVTVAVATDDEKSATAPPLENHREDFKRLLGAAVKQPKSSD